MEKSEKEEKSKKIPLGIPFTFWLKASGVGALAGFLLGLFLMGNSLRTDPLGFITVCIFLTCVGAIGSPIAIIIITDSS